MRKCVLFILTLLVTGCHCHNTSYLRDPTAQETQWMEQIKAALPPEQRVSVKWTGVVEPVGDLTGLPPTPPPANTTLGNARVMTAEAAPLNEKGLPDKFIVEQAGSLPSMDQRKNHCGACWAFALTAQIESDFNSGGYNGQRSKVIPRLVLSPQFVISCSEGGTCTAGGWPHIAGQNLKLKGLAIPTWNDYPYTGSTSNCPMNLKGVIVINDAFMFSRPGLAHSGNLKREAL